MSDGDISLVIYGIFVVFLFIAAALVCIVAWPQRRPTLSKKAVEKLTLAIVVEGSDVGMQSVSDNNSAEGDRVAGTGTVEVEKGSGRGEDRSGSSGGDGGISDEAAECAICLAEVAAGETLRQLPQCGHTFHVCCIDKWLVKHSATCPFCRTPIDNPSTPYSGRRLPFMDCILPTPSS